MAATLEAPDRVAPVARAPSASSGFPALASADDGDLGPANFALADPCVLATVFAGLDGASLGRCAAVCREWRTILCRDVGADAAIWRASYLLEYGREALPHEWVGSYRGMYTRAAGLLALPPPTPLPLSGAAVTYSAGAACIVAYDPRTARLATLAANGTSLRSVAVPDRGAAPGGAALGRPLLAPLARDLVVLTTGDGVLQLWDVRLLVPAGTLGAHYGPLTSLAADNTLVGSTCAGELRLWEVDVAAAERAAVAARTAAEAAAGAPPAAAASVPPAATVSQDAGMSAPSRPPQQALLDAARAPAGRCLSAQTVGTPLGAQVPGPIEPRVVVCASRRLAALAHAAAPLPSPVIKVFCAAPATAGTLLRELPVNAAADLAFLPGRLVVISAFHGRATGGGERAYTVVAHVWDTDTWAWSRLVSPRLSTSVPMNAPGSLPLLHATQDWILVATPSRPVAPGAPPSCALNAWRLPRCTNSASAAGGDKAVRLRAEGQGQEAAGGSAAAGGGGGGPAQLAPGQRPPVFLFVGEGKGHDPWHPVLADTGPGRLAGVSSSPERLLLTTVEGQLRASLICVPPPPPTRRGAIW